MSYLKIKKKMQLLAYSHAGLKFQRTLAITMTQHAV